METDFIFLEGLSCQYVLQFVKGVMLIGSGLGKIRRVGYGCTFTKSGNDRKGSRQPETMHGVMGASFPDGSCQR